MQSLQELRIRNANGSQITVWSPETCTNCQQEMPACSERWSRVVKLAKLAKIKSQRASNKGVLSPIPLVAETNKWGLFIPGSKRCKSGKSDISTSPEQMGPIANALANQNQMGLVHLGSQNL